jgi:hypothetical protein
MLKACVVTMTVGLATAPAAHAAPACTKTKDGPRYTAQRVAGGNTTAIATCDHRTGAARTLHRSRAAMKKGRTVRGTRIVAAAAGGRRLAWIEVVAPDGPARRSTATLRTADIVTGRRGRTRVLRRGAGARVLLVDGLVVSARDDLAWTIGPQLWIWRAGAQPHAGTRRAGQLDLVDGYTLVGVDGQPIDLRSPKQRDGCPQRPSAVTVAATPALMVTRAQSASTVMEDGTWDIWRVCDRASHRETAVYQDFSVKGFTAGGGADLEGVAGPYVLLAVSQPYGHYEPNPPHLRLFDSRDGRLVRDEAAGPYKTPETWNDVILLDDGSFAWIAAQESAHGAPRALLLARIGAPRALLDAEAPGPQGLTASGRTLSWTNGGAQRSYAVP